MSNKEKSKYMGLKLIEIKNNKKSHQVSQLNIILFTKNIKIPYKFSLLIYFTYLTYINFLTIYVKYKFFNIGYKN
jgi:hypothetical protein